MTNDIKTKDGKLVVCTVSTAVRDQIPKEIAADFPNFVDFMEHYYKWMELEGNAHYGTVCIQDTLDVDRTVDAFLEFFKETYLYNIPVDFFGVDRCEQETFIVNEDFGGALTYKCLCESESVKWFVDPAATVAIDFFPEDFLIAANWMISVRNEVTGEMQAMHMIATHDGTNTFDTIYATIGGNPDYDLETSIIGSTFELNLTNNEAERLIVEVIRAPAFTESEEIGPQRTFLFSKEINDLTEVKVTVNGNVLDTSLYTIGNPISFCDNAAREITINEPIILAVGDTVVIEACEQRDVDQRLLIKNIQRLLKEKGTEESFRLLFRLLFNEEIEMEYPGDNILKVSDGKWQSNRMSIRVSTKGTPENFLYRNASIVRYINGEPVVTASFTVEAVETQLIENYSVATLFITNITGVIQNSNNLVLVEGEYIPEYQVVVEYTDLDGSEVSEAESMYPIINELEVTAGGTGYNAGARVPVSEDFTFVKTIDSVVGTPDTIDTGVSVALVGVETEVYVNAGLVSNYTLFGSQVVFDTPLSANDSVEIRMLSKGAYISIRETDGAGAVLSFRIFDSGVGYDGTNTVDLSALGNGDATADTLPDGIILSYDGRYLNADGHLSACNVIQDGYRNQGFSYIIRSSRTVDQYGDILKQLLHPAGFLGFGEILLVNCVHMMITGAAYEYSFPPVPSFGHSANFATAPKLGPRYRSFDENKLRYMIWRGIEPNTQVQIIYDELVGYFINTPDDTLNYLLDGHVGISAELDVGLVAGASAAIILPYDIVPTDNITAEGDASGTIFVDPGLINYDTNTIVFDADVGGENVTVFVGINTCI